MRILLVSAIPPPFGGLATWTEKYLDYCKEHSFETSLVNIAVSGSRMQKINNRKRILDEIPRTFRILTELRNSLNRSHFDVVHINTTCGRWGLLRDLLCVRKVFKKKIYTVLHFHCNLDDWIYGRLSLWAINKMTRMVDQILVLNSASESFISRISKTKPIIIPNFIDADFLLDSHNTRKYIKQVVFVGHVQATKGCRELMEAAVQLSDIRFVLIGPVSDEIAKLPCPENVLMVGEKCPSEVKQYLEKSDVYVLPSYTEGFSLSLTEAMGVGLPAVATDVGSNKDMLENIGGVIIPVRNAQEIVCAIQSISSCERRKKMSEWNLKKVANYYLTDRVMSLIIEIYQSNHVFK